MEKGLTSKNSLNSISRKLTSGTLDAAKARIERISEERYFLVLADGLGDAIANYKADRKAVAEIAAHIQEEFMGMASMFNVANPLNASQLKEIAYAVIDQGDLSIEDISLFARSVTTGYAKSSTGAHEYEKTMHRLDIEVFNSWLNTFRLAKAEQREAMLIKQQQELNEPLRGLDLSDITKEYTRLEELKYQEKTEPEPVTDRQKAVIGKTLPLMSTEEKAQLAQSCYDSGNHELGDWISKQISQ